MRLLFCLALCAFACGSAPDIGGMYQISDYRIDHAGCGAGDPVPSAPAFFRAKKNTLLGHDFYAVDLCSSTDMASCTQGSLGVLLSEGNDTGWTGYYSISSAGQTSCELIYSDQRATLTGNTLRIEVKQHKQDDPSLTGSACDPKVATSRGTSMPCVEATLLVGNRVM